MQNLNILNSYIMNIENKFYECKDKYYFQINLLDDFEKIILENNINIFNNEKLFRNYFQMFIHLSNHLTRNEVNYPIIIVKKPTSQNKIIKTLQKWFQEELLSIDNKAIGFELNNVTELIEDKNKFINYYIYKTILNTIKVFPAFWLFVIYNINNQNIITSFLNDEN